MPNLKLCFWFCLPCMTSCVCHIFCLHYIQKNWKLSIWPPLCPPNIQQSNWIILLIVCDLNHMLCSVVVGPLLQIFELDLQSWSIHICDMAKKSWLSIQGSTPFQDIQKLNTFCDFILCYVAVNWLPISFIHQYTYQGPKLAILYLLALPVCIYWYLCLLY